MSESPAPGPGVYPDVPFEQYLKWPYLSNSALAPAAKSMAHYNARLPVEETQPMRFGSLCHAGRLEPIAIPMRYVVMPAFEDQVRRADGTEYASPRATNAYKSLVEKFESENSDKKVVTQKEYNDMQQVVRSLCRHERASQYFASGPRSQVELSLVWDDPETKLRLKARIDMKQPGRITDLKTTKDPMDFNRQIAFRGYHRQAAMYLDGWEILKGERCEYCLVAVENTAPFTVRAAPLSVDDIDAGREQYKDLLRQIRDCRISEVWPGYEDPKEWKIPANLEAKSDFELTLAGEVLSLS